MLLYHYYERQGGPLRNLSDLPLHEARLVLAGIRAAGNSFAARRREGYLERRRELEQLARERFAAKGGKPERDAPHYFTVESCAWLETWYRQPAHIKLSAEELDSRAISFTYGDLFPTFSPLVQDGKEYRNTVYTFEEIFPIIEAYGLPQVWNADGEAGPERYIEAQVWCDIDPALWME